MNEKSKLDRDTHIEKALENWAESGVSSRDLETRILQSVKKKDEKRDSIFSNPTLRWGASAAVLALLIALLGWSVWPARLPAERTAGEGLLLVDGAPRPVPEAFQYGSRVSTLKSQLRLNLDKNTQLLLDQNTVVVLVSEKEMKLESGRIAYYHTDGQHRAFHLVTPAGTIEPIGTGFDAVWSGDRLLLQVFEGAVHFHSGESVQQVHSRQQLIYEQGQAQVGPQQSLIDPWWQNGFSFPWTKLLEGRNN